ncbi:MAG: flagellar protein FlaG [Steroidobacteraceae bacterium]
MSDDGMTVRSPVAVAQPGPSARPQPEPAAAPAVQPHAKPRPAKADIEAVARQLESFLKRVSRSLEFHVDDASGRMVCSVRDAETGDLIRQIPNEEVLRLAELAHDETIVLVNERV